MLYLHCFYYKHWTGLQHSVLHTMQQRPQICQLNEQRCSEGFWDIFELISRAECGQVSFFSEASRFLQEQSSHYAPAIWFPSLGSASGVCHFQFSHNLFPHKLFMHPLPRLVIRFAWQQITQISCC